MSTKDFCDECKKEILEIEKSFEVCPTHYPFRGITYCASCFKKHWNGPLPKKED